ncbi:Macrophage mannose receptor 1 [Chelonia mydas]|uniref:Macrophage mannose receptor 1 n=1 Tax=Chelonia mydas TaxID=8469 RepID=M7B2M2_CHEMY|nr:Macrophage mannose receptor 1 [Chelonia mydas]
MACKATYSNVDIIEPGQEDPWGSEPRAKAAVSDVYTEEESQYEAVDPAVGARRRQTEQQEARAPDMEMASALERMQVENQLLRDVASGSFLIYSESHQLCVDVTASGSLTAMPWSPGTLSQHFQWLSQGQLLSVAHQQCVAVPKRLSRVAVRLEPCKAHRELQHWECRANGLLALARENLYFNYGNNQNHVVMLYSGVGPWSRWVIYGSHEDLCSCSCHVCTPCRRGWTFFQDSCYFHSRSLGTWDVANRSCASLGALLLQVTSLAEQAHIMASMKAPSSWMGLTDQALEGAWMWVDGTHSAANARYWRPGLG